jgi:hypothetical protein
MSNGRKLGEYVSVGSFTLLGDVRLAQSALEGEGIAVHLEGIEFASALPHMSNAVGGVTVFVPAADVERAREILDASGGGESATPEDAAVLEGDAAEVGARAAAARRAWRAAVLGLVFLPPLLHVISAWQLVAYARDPGPTTRRARRQARGALLIDALVVIALATLVIVKLRP